MINYYKFCPNVFLAKSTEQHKRGDIIEIETKYGKINKHVVCNEVASSNGCYYYSIIREDGYNVQERAKRKAERLETASMNADKKSNAYWEASKEGKDFLSLAEPIKIGHHSEKRHRALIERNSKRMDKCVEFSKTSEQYSQRAEYWKRMENTINLSMPESLEYYEHKLQEAKEKHEGLKNGTIEKRHDYSLVYAKKEVNELEKKLKLAVKLWKND